MMKFVALFITAMFLSSFAKAAETHRIALQHGEASAQELAVKVGSKIEIFHNDDTGAVHRLYVKDGVHDFDLSGMKHGDHFDFKVLTEGVFRIHCHAMKDMVITVRSVR